MHSKLVSPATLTALVIGQAAVISAVPGPSATGAGVTTIQRDVVVIGGGATGVYAATKLRRLGVSFAVIEKNAQFGGHTATYTIPGTNVTIDYGVQGYTGDAHGNYSLSQNFFSTYNIPTEFWKGGQTGGGGVRRFFDFRSFTELNNFTYSQDFSQLEPLVAQYPFLEYQTAPPQPVPADLLLPFGDFITKHGLQATVYHMFSNAQGLGDFLAQPTYYVLKELSPAYLLTMSPGSPGALVTSRHYNQEVYLRAQAEFGAHALVSSTILSVTRSSTGVTIMIQTPTGVKRVQAKKILVTAPPTLSNMGVFDLSADETRLFSKFAGNGWWAGLVNVTGLPADNAFQNAGINRPYNLPVLPALYQLTPTFVPGIYLFRYGSDGYIAESQIRAEVVSGIERLRAAVVGTGSALLPPVQLLSLANHFPFNLHVTANDIAGGFYSRLDALQGKKSTWYGGGAFFVYSAPKLWNVTEGLVDRLVAA